MTGISLRRAGAIVLLAAFACAAALVPQVARPHVTSAQSAQTTTPLNLCGTLASYSQTSVTFTTNNVNVVYPIASINSFVVQPAQIGQDVCFVGQVNTQNPAQIVSGTLTANYTSPVVVCGTVNAYVPSTPSTTGSLSIGSSTIPVGINANFSGTPISVNQNLCITGTVNALGQLTLGTVSSNTGSAATVTPISACGTISNYAAPGASNGAVTITTPTVQVTYVILAGATVNPAAFTGTGTSNVCLVGTLNAGNQLTRVTFSTNPTQSPTLAVCGVISAYTAATPGQIGSLTIGGVVVPLALSANFTGQPIVLQSNVCVQGSFNGLGELVTGTVGVNPNAPTATPTITLTPTATLTATATSTGTPIPATVTATATATSTNTPLPAATATATSTAVPPTATATATDTPVPPTVTPTPKPPKKYRAAFSYLSVWYHVIRVKDFETVVVQAKKRVQHGIWLTVHFPNGKSYAYYTNTDKRGFWSTRFQIPPSGVTKLTNQALVTAQLWYKNTSAKSYATFIIV